MFSRAWLATAAASGLVLTPLGWIPSAEAQAPGVGSVTVDVRDFYSGADLAGIQVTLYSTATGASVATGTTPTDDPGTPGDESSGTVGFEGLDVGTYTAKAHAPAGTHQDRYSTGEVVSADDSYQYASIRMTPVNASFGRLKGTVSQLTDGDLDATLQVYPSSVTTAAIESGEAQPANYAYAYGYARSGEPETLTDGWDVKLAPGSYKVLAVDRDSRTCEYVDGSLECTTTRTAWAGGATAETATVLTVTAGRSSTLAGVTLPAEVENGVSRITGTVTGPGGTKLDDVDVDLLQKLGSTWVEVSSTETGADGTFGFSRARECEVLTYENGDYDYDYVSCDSYAPVGAGTFTLRFSDDDTSYYSPAAGEFATVYFGNVAPAADDPGEVPASAATVTLGATGAQTASASMARIPLHTSSGLFGKLTDTTGSAHRGSVTIFDLSGNMIESINTRRDGTWSLPVTSLAPGQYKLSTRGEDLVPGWVGGRTFAAARTYTVPVKGAANAGSSSQQRYATLSGKIAVTGVKGVDAADTSVVIYDAKGRQYDSAETDAAGNFVAVVVPGTYFLSADGEAYDSFDESDAQISSQPLIERFWKAAWTAATANRFTATSGARVAGLNLTLSDQLVATARPTITGRVAVGKILRASAGAWNETESVAYTYVWKRGAKVVSTKATYKVTRSDKRKTLTVTVTARDASGTYRAGTTSAAVKGPKKGPRKG